MQNVSPRVPPRFSVILVQFSHGNLPRTASHDSPICAGLSSFGKPAGFTLLFACDSRSSLTWRVFDTHARVCTRAVRFSQKSRACDVRLPTHAVSSQCSTSTRRRRWKSRAIRRCSMSVRDQEIHKWLRRDALVYVCVYTYMYRERANELVCVNVCACVHGDDETSRRAAATQTAPRRDGPERIGRQFGTGPHLEHFRYRWRRE